MLEPKLIDDLAERIGQALPPGVRQLQQEFEKNLRTGLQSAFSRLDLVTREEFEVQQAVLARTRSRLEALERQVIELEARLSATQTPSSPVADGDC